MVKRKEESRKEKISQNLNKKFLLAHLLFTSYHLMQFTVILGTVACSLLTPGVVGPPPSTLLPVPPTATTPLWGRGAQYSCWTVTSPGPTPLRLPPWGRRRASRAGYMSVIEPLSSPPHLPSLTTTHVGKHG
jgi:hypothetical protein